MKFAKNLFKKIKDWILFFQGNHQRLYLKYLKDTLKKQGITNVIISEEFYDQIEDVDRTVMSSDIGIAWYNDISVNFRTAGKSSGKIPSYFRFGLPVIAKKFPSTMEAIETTGRGLCIDDFREIEVAVSRIEKDYEQFSKNARLEYDKNYRFENYKNKIIDFINTK